MGFKYNQDNSDIKIHVYGKLRVEVTWHILNLLFLILYKINKTDFHRGHEVKTLYFTPKTRVFFSLKQDILDAPRHLHTFAVRHKSR